MRQLRQTLLRSMPMQQTMFAFEDEGAAILFSRSKPKNGKG
jgi:hypothetical protein